jgi:O-antigen/teichoic acid export membrane protein
MTLAMFYKSDSAFAPYASLLQIMLLTQLLVYVHSLTGSFFNALERSRVAFYGQLIYTVVIVTVAYPLASISLQAAVLGTTLAAIAHVAFLGFMILRLRGEQRVFNGERVIPERERIMVGASPSAAT